MRRRRPVVSVSLLASFSLLVFLASGAAASAASESAGLEGHWVGSADPWGDPRLVELAIASGEARIVVYGRAPLDFDAPVFSGNAVSEVREAGTDVSFALDLAGDRYRFDGARYGDVLAGTLEGDGPATTLRLFRVPDLSTEQAARLVGIYGECGQRVAVTWREFGGLRAIDLETGRSRSLFPVDDRSFFTGADLAHRASPRVTYRFPRDREGGIAALVIGPGSEGEVLARHDTFAQEPFSFEAIDGVRLRGTLLLPRGQGPHPAVVLVHGSGPIYRTALFQRAVLFAERGIAVLIYDKRGTGASGGTWRGDRFPTLIADVHAAVDAVRAHDAIDPASVGLQGHSQAGFLIPAVAAADPMLAFAIVVNGGSIRPGEQSLYDKENDLRRAGFNAAERERALDLMRRLQAYVRDREGDRAALERDYLAARAEPWFEVTDLPDISAIPSWDDPPPAMVEWSRELAFDPVPFQRRMRCPVLVLVGEADETVPPQTVADVWRETLEARGHRASRVETIPGADHGMRIAVGGERRLTPAYTSIQLDWLQAVLCGDGTRPAIR